MSVDKTHQKHLMGGQLQEAEEGTHLVQGEEFHLLADHRLKIQVLSNLNTNI